MKNIHAHIILKPTYSRGKNTSTLGSMTFYSFAKNTIYVFQVTGSWHIQCTGTVKGSNLVGDLQY